MVTADDNHGGTLISYVSGPAPRGEAVVEAPTSLDMGAFHVGDTAAETVDVGNLALQGGDALVGGFGAISGPFGGTGVLDVAPVQSGALSVTLDTSADGAKTGTAAFNLESDNAYDPDIALRVDPMTLTAAVYAYAAPELTDASVALGAARVDDAALTGEATLSDGSVADAYQEALAYQVLGAPDDFTITGATGSVASGSAGEIGLSLATGQSGVVSGALDLELTSRRDAGTGLSDTTLADQSIAYTAKIYALAQASYSTARSTSAIYTSATRSTKISASPMPVRARWSTAWSAASPEASPASTRPAPSISRRARAAR